MLVPWFETCDEFLTAARAERSLLCERRVERDEPRFEGGAGAVVVLRGADARPAPMTQGIFGTRTVLHVHRPVSGGRTPQRHIPCTRMHLV